MFLKSATGTMPFPPTIYIHYNIFDCNLCCCKYHDLSALGFTTELHFVNMIVPILILRWDVGQSVHEILLIYNIYHIVIV